MKLYLVFENFNLKQKLWKGSGWCWHHYYNTKLAETWVQYSVELLVLNWNF